MRPEARRGRRRGPFLARLVTATGAGSVAAVHRDFSADELGYWRRLSRRRPLGYEGIERLLVMVVQLLAKQVGGTVPPQKPAGRVIAPWLFAPALRDAAAESETEQHLRLLRMANEEADGFDAS